MTYTDEKVNLVINKMTQAQYEQAKSEGILKDNELYIVPDNAPVDVPTKLSELENDVGFLDGSDKDELNERIDLIEATSHPNMNVIGSPTFSQGSVGGFSDEDYLMFPTSVNVGQNNVDFYMTFTTGDNVGAQENILDSWCGLALAIQNGHFILAASSNGTTFNTADGSQEVLPNTSYDIKIAFTHDEGGDYHVQLLVHDALDASINMNAPLFATATYWGGANPASGVNHIFTGTINLNECWMSWNGEVVWKGYSELPIPTKVSQLENDSGYVTSSEIPDFSEVVRYETYPNGNNAVTIGTRGEEGTTGNMSLSVGENNVGGYRSVVIGNNNKITSSGNSLVVGDSSLADGWNNLVMGQNCSAFGHNAVALGNECVSNGGIALGDGAKVWFEGWGAFAWSGDGQYDVTAPNTFNIKPADGTDGFYIGDKNLTTIMNEAINGAIGNVLTQEEF